MAPASPMGPPEPPSVRHTRGTTTVEWLVLAAVLLLLVAVVGLRVHSKLNPEKAALPDWVPSYPGAAPTKHSSSSNQTTISEDVRFETTDPPAKVLEFYYSALKGSGFIVDRPQPGSDFLNSRKCESTRRVSVRTHLRENGKTEVVVGYFDFRPEWGPRTEPAQEAKLPAWVPAYPGMSMLADPSHSSDQYQYWQAYFKTFDPPQKVFEYYAAALAKPGFTVQVSWSQPSDHQFGGRITAQETAGRRKVIVEMPSNSQKECQSKVEVSWFGVAADEPAEEVAGAKTHGRDTAKPPK